jgi:hypothetical protein
MLPIKTKSSPQDIIQRYRLPAEEVAQQVGLILTNHPALIEESIRADLQNTIDNLDILISEARDSSDNLQYGLEKILSERMQRVDNTLLSPWLNPNISTNQLSKELFQHCFPNHING